MPRPKQNASLEQLTPYFHLPIKAASLKLGVCTTVLKRICRDHGISRWPYRQIKSLDKKICNKIACLLLPTPNETNKTVQQIVELYKFSKDESTDDSMDSSVGTGMNLKEHDTVTYNKSLQPTTNLEKHFKNQALAHQHILKLSPVTAVINTIAPIVHNTSSHHHHHHHHHHTHNTSLRPTNNSNIPMVSIPTHINTSTPMLNTTNVNMSTYHRYNNSTGSNELRSAFKPTSQKIKNAHQSALSKMNIDFLVQSANNNAFVNTIVAN